MLQQRTGTENLDRPWPQLAVDALANGYWQDATNEFVRFRKLMRPRMIQGWFGQVSRSMAKPRPNSENSKANNRNQ
jgi:hypothetical protein